MGGARREIMCIGLNVEREGGGGFYNDVRIVCGGDKRILEMHWLVTIF